MADRRQREKSGIARFLLGMAIINILPIGAFLWVGYALWSGQKTIEDFQGYFPEGASVNMLHLSVAMAVLFLVGTFLVPVSHGSVKRLRAQLNPESGRTFLDLVLWLPRQVLLVFCEVVRSAGFALGIVSILLTLLFMGRMLSPGFLSEYVPIEEWVAWVRDRL